jgi:hypothetical protein
MLVRFRWVLSAVSSDLPRLDLPGQVAGFEQLATWHVRPLLAGGVAAGTTVGDRDDSLQIL